MSESLNIFALLLTHEASTAYRIGNAISFSLEMSTPRTDFRFTQRVTHYPMICTEVWHPNVYSISFTNNFSKVICFEVVQPHYFRTDLQITMALICQRRYFHVLTAVSLEIYKNSTLSFAFQQNKCTAVFCFPLSFRAVHIVVNFKTILPSWQFRYRRKTFSFSSVYSSSLPSTNKLVLLPADHFLFIYLFLSSQAELFEVLPFNIISTISRSLHFGFPKRLVRLS